MSSICAKCFIKDNCPEKSDFGGRCSSFKSSDQYEDQLVRNRQNLRRRLSLKDQMYSRRTRTEGVRNRGRYHE